MPAFTRAIVGVVEALVFGAEPEARRLARQLLEQAGDDRAMRAAEIFRRVVLGEMVDLEASVVCAACGAQDLALWFTGQTWGETLCAACYAARVETGQARHPDAP